MPTFTQIGTAVTVGAGGASSISFTSIPSTYTDLVLKTSLRDSNTVTRSLAQLTFNGSATSYSSLAEYGFNGGSVGAAVGGGTYIDWTYTTGNGATASTFSNSEIYIPNYAGSQNKSVSIDFAAENNSATLNILGIASGLWSNSAAITSITLTPASPNFLEHSTAYLYGVSNA
jgi:hypothetical protein